MSHSSRLPSRVTLLLFLLCAVVYASTALADPSGRVAYLSDTRGVVSYSPAGEDEWIGVVRNRPLIRGDRLWTDEGSRAEFQVGSSAIRIASNTSVEILDLDDRIAQLQLTQGTINLSVRRLYSDQIIEVDTPLLAFTITRAGRYRIDVDPESGATTIVVWDGAGEAYGENANFSMRAGDTVRFYDTDLRDYEMYSLPREDDFDHYSMERDYRFERSESLQYVDDDLVGYADLDEYGSWDQVRGHGHVWFPSRVDVGWAPYRDGYWVWQEPWGWTWVDNAPWGFAPSHYGRWVYVRNQWGWVPGPRHVRPIYAPALVAFIGGSGWSLSLSLGGGYSAIGWFPLGPREVYVPSYHASRDYFNRVNVNNTVINNTTITNVYNNYSSGTINVNQVNYANRSVEHAVTAVPSNVFVNAQAVAPAKLQFDRKAGTSGDVMRVAPIAPSVSSVIGKGEVAKARPARDVFNRKVIARNAPPPAVLPFAKREKLLQKSPGRAPEPAAAETVQSSDTKPAKNVRVIGEQKDAVDVRAAGSRRAGKSAQPQPLDRSVETRKAPEGGKADTQQATKQQQQEQSKAAARREEQQQRKAAGDKAAAQQEEQQQRKAAGDKAAAQREEQQQRKAASDKAAAQQEEQQQRKAASDKAAAQQRATAAQGCQRQSRCPARRTTAT